MTSLSERVTEGCSTERLLGIKLLCIHLSDTSHSLVQPIINLLRRTRAATLVIIFGNLIEAVNNVVACADVYVPLIKVSIA
jgi:hypothetical protein